jgi:hypothetical protein
MPSLKETVKALHGIHTPRGTGELDLLDPYYKPLHLAWLGDQRPWSPAAQEHARKVFAGEYTHERRGRISPSAIGNACEREILFSFGGAPEVPAPEESEDVMESGTFEHLRWQMEGLTHPFLISAEGWNHSVELRCGGSMDGVGLDYSLFELKNCAPHLYASISRGWDYLMEAAHKAEKTGVGSAANYAASMVRKHVTQAETYVLLDSLRSEPRLSGVVSLVYQDRSSKDVFEMRFTSSAKRQREVHAILASVHEWIDLDELPDMLEGCAKTVTPGLTPTEKEKTVFKRCGHREHCPTSTTVMWPVEHA